MAFAVCGLPLVWQCVVNRSAKDVNSVFLALWSIGEVCYVVQVMVDYGFVPWMMFNYLMNILFIAVILYFKVKR